MYRLNGDKKSKTQSTSSDTGMPRMVITKNDINLMLESKTVYKKGRPSIDLNYDQGVFVRTLLALQELYEKVGIKADFELDKELFSE